MRARMLVDAKIVRADPEHPVAVYLVDDEIEGPAAELQVALGHAQALPEVAPASPVEGSQDRSEAPKGA